MKKRIIIPVICFLAAASLIISGKGLFFYKGMYQAPSVELPSPKDITVAAPKVEPPSEVSERRAGTVLVDFVHDNNFGPPEVSTLLSRVISQGFSIEFIRVGSSGGGSQEDLRNKLRYADALVVISPGEPFSAKEIGLVEEFVGKGGKLLLIEDPTRRPREDLFGVKRGVPINDLAGHFGLLFESDYLYNLRENEGNYRHVFFTEFSQSQLTKDLTRIALYSAGSLSGSGKGIVFADGNTLSSSVGAKDKLSPVVLAADARVLGIYDLTFMMEPFNASFDNNRLISNVSDWLTKSERDFSLADFPYFLKDTSVVAYADVSLLRRGLELKDFLQESGRTVSVAKYAESTDLTQDTVFLALSKDATKVEKFLEKGNIKLVGTDIEIASIGSIPQADTSVIYLYENGTRHLLAVLAGTEKRLQETVKLLKSGDFRQWLVSDRLAIIPADEK